MSGIENGDTVVSLRAQLMRTELQASARQHQLERYAADLREVFKDERARTQELRGSYKATVRALSNAVEARDATVVDVNADHYSILISPLAISAVERFVGAGVA